VSVGHADPAAFADQLRAALRETAGAEGRAAA
jgi:hypothetical protein